MSRNGHLRGIYVVSEIGCTHSDSGAWRHIAIGIEELSKQFELQTLLAKTTQTIQPIKPSHAPTPRGFRNSKFFGVVRDIRDFAKNLRVGWDFFQKIRRARPEFCYCRANFLDPLPLLLALTQQCRVFIEANGIQFETRASRFRSPLVLLHKAFERWTYSSADYVFFVGSYGDYWKLPSCNWMNVENGVERSFVESFQWSIKKKGEAVNFCVIARLIGHHQVDVLENAIIALPPEDVSALTLNLFGTGFDAVKKRLAGVVKVVDHGFMSREALTKELQTMDAGIITASLEYASHMKLFDYGAAKMVAVVPATHNLKSWFNDSEVMFFEPSDPKSLSRCIRALSKRGDQAGRGEALHKRIQKDFLWETVFQRKADIIRRVCAGEHGR